MTIALSLLRKKRQIFVMRIVSFGAIALHVIGGLFSSLFYFTSKVHDLELLSLVAYASILIVIMSAYTLHMPVQKHLITLNQLLSDQINWHLRLNSVECGSEQYWRILENGGELF